MIRNVHERVVDAPIERLGALLDGLGQKGDRLWPSQNWPPMVLDRPVSEGGAGGHGAIRYHVAEYEPGARVRFAFEPATGIDGAHELSLDELACGRSFLWRWSLFTTPSSRTCSTTPNARRRERSPARRNGLCGCACSGGSSAKGNWRRTTNRGGGRRSGLFARGELRDRHDEVLDPRP